MMISTPKGTHKPDTAEETYFFLQASKVISFFFAKVFPSPPQTTGRSRQTTNLKTWLTTLLTTAPTKAPPLT